MSVPVLSVAGRLEQIQAALRALDYADTQTNLARRALQIERAALITELEETEGLTDLMPA